MVTIMKKLFNISYIALFAVLALFSACTESEGYTPAQPCAETNAYRFDSESSSNVILALEDSIYKVVLQRDSIDDDVTLPLNIKGDVDVLSAPNSVTFAAGEKEAVLEIAIAPQMQPFKNYYLEISIDEEYVNPYTADNFSVLPITFLKEDYVVVAKGIYTRPALIGGAKVGAYLEYSPLLDTYRIDGWGTGNSITFKLTDPETMEFEMTEDAFVTGYSSSGYSIYAIVLGNYNTYDAETQTFNFAFQWGIPSADYYWEPAFETFQIT
jgi:hypothetical protein